MILLGTYLSTQTTRVSELVMIGMIIPMTFSFQILNSKTGSHDWDFTETLNPLEEQHSTHASYVAFFGHYNL